MTFTHSRRRFAQTRVAVLLVSSYVGDGEI